MPYPYLEGYPGNWPIPNRLMRDPNDVSLLYQQYLDEMALAESMGFDAIACNEHHFSAYGLMANPVLIGAALSQRTERVKLAMVGALVPMNNPIRIAEEYAMLDQLSGGRLIAGFMRGTPWEYVAYNMNPDESWPRFEEAWDLIVKAWTEPEPFGWEGVYYQYKTISLWPRPLQQPHPPVLMAGGSSESVRFAANRHAIMGIGFADAGKAKRQVETYRRMAREAGWEPRRDQFLFDQVCYVGETDAEARETFSKHYQYYLTTLFRPVNYVRRLVETTTEYYREQVDRSSPPVPQEKLTLGFDLDELVERGYALCGAPDTVIQQIKRTLETVGNGIMMLRFQTGSLPHELVLENMKRFEKEVLPVVRDF